MVLKRYQRKRNKIEIQTDKIENYEKSEFDTDS